MVDINEIINRPPADVDAEQYLLTALLLHKQMKVFHLLQPDHFHDLFHAWMFKVIRTGINQKRAKVDWPISFLNDLLTARNKKKANLLGCRNLAFELGSWIVEPGGQWRDVDPKLAIQCAKRILLAFNLRSQLDDHVRQIIANHRRWNDSVRSLKGWNRC